MTCAEPPVPPNYSNPDTVVQRIVEIINAFEFAVLYPWLLRLARRRWANARIGFAYVYVAGWALILLAALGTGRYWAGSWWAAVAVFAAAWRTLDIARWWSDFLLDRRHRVLVSRERNLVCLILNLFEVTLAGAVFFRATGIFHTAHDAWFGALFEATQLGLPDGTNHFWNAVAVAAVEVTSLLLLLGGLGTLVGIISAKVGDTSDSDAESRHGRLEWPWLRPAWAAERWSSPLRETSTHEGSAPSPPIG